MQINYLVRQGVAKSRITRQLGISRQSMYNHLKRLEPFPKRVTYYSPREQDGTPYTGATQCVGRNRHSLLRWRGWFTET